MALTISGTSNGKLGNLSLSASTGDILDSANTTFFGVDMWKLSSAFTITARNLTAANTVTGWERNETDGVTKIGTGLTESSGTFTFPSTGIYLIKCVGVFGSVANNYQSAIIATTKDNSSYTDQTNSHCWNNSGDYTSSINEVIFDVTDTSNCKFRIRAFSDYANQNLMGSSVRAFTYVIVNRLGDT
jgi:hypothetical protein